MIYFRGIKARQSLQNSSSICFISFGSKDEVLAWKTSSPLAASIMKLFISGIVLCGQLDAEHEPKRSQFLYDWSVDIETPLKRGDWNNPKRNTIFSDVTL
jgi:hypothetical protein